MKNLTEIGECVFVHYSCDLFHIGERVFVIGVRNNEKTEIWTATNEQEEILAIKSLYDYLLGKPEKVIIHWNMNAYEFGPQHLIRRYKQLTGMDLPVIVNDWFNLSGYLWENYEEYAPHPRLKNLCEMNGIRLYGFHADPTNYSEIQAKTHKVVSHLSAIERIYHKERVGKLQVVSSGPKRVEQEQIVCSFSELLNEPDKLPQYIQALHIFREENKIVVIDENGRFIKRNGNISIILAWADTLKIKGKFSKEVSDNKLAQLLNNQFPGLKISTEDASIIRKPTATKSKYQPEFLALIK